MIVKVCGMKFPENIRQVARCGADWMGFICYEKSPRFIGTEKPESTPRQKRVGVFVNSDKAYILDHANKWDLQMAQLHGNEPPELCRQLREAGLQVIKAFQANEENLVSKTEAYAPFCDYFLFDTPCNNYGGSGLSFQWELLSLYKGTTPFLLSGGIRPESLQALSGFRHPLWAGIDLNSGFETQPAQKDAASLHSFITRFKQLSL